MKKSIFSAKKINTVKDFTNLLCTLTKNMLVGSKEDMLDYYSIKKSFWIIWNVGIKKKKE